MHKKRRHPDKLTFQKELITTDDYGAQPNYSNWSNLLSVKGKVEEGKGGEDVLNDIQEGVENYITIYCRAPRKQVISEVLRIIYQGLIYDIDRVEIENKFSVPPYYLKITAHTTQTKSDVSNVWILNTGIWNPNGIWVSEGIWN